MAALSVLLLDNATARLGDRAVLDGVSLAVRPGEFVALVGPNGAGKSSMVRVLGGLLPLTGGVARLGGDDVADLSPRERAARVAYLPQERRIAWNLPAVEVAALGAPFLAVDEAMELARRALAEVEAEHLADRGVAELSGGERARVLLARALATDAAAVMLDEPIAGLDPEAQLIVLERLRARADGGQAVLASLHDLPLAARFAHRVAVLDHGAVAADGAPLAAVMNYACHAVCLMEDSYLLTADYPGFARHFLEERLGGGTALFLNGACGDVNPREAAVGHGLASGGSFRIAERAGRNVAQEAARVWRKVNPTDDITLSFARRTISLPGNHDRALQAAEKALADIERAASQPAEIPPYVTWRSRPSVTRARAALARAKERGSGPICCEVQAVRVGPIAFVGWPGEVFCELGMDLKERSPFRPTYVIGYANGAIGYVPTPEAFGEGGYEAESAAHLADEAGLVLVDESLALLSSVQ